MASEVVTMRIPKQSKKRLERFSRFVGKKVSDASAMLLEEALRHIEHSFIDFRNSQIGRQAYLEGTRLPVWLIWKVFHELGGSVSKTVKHFQLSEAKVNAALHYADQYPEEIQTAIEDDEACDQVVLKGLLPETKVIELGD